MRQGGSVVASQSRVVDELMLHAESFGMSAFQ
jgi:hypothetical protein